MKIATFNVNGINGRLPVLLRWLAATAPDVVCLQELKAADEKFPAAAIGAAGYGAVWHGQKSWNGVAILARRAEPIETRRGLPGDADDAHSRYLEAAVRGLVAQAWTDALRALHPDERIYTFWDYLRNACASSSWAKSRRSTRHARPGAVAVATTFANQTK
jgi:exonuclease III